MKLKRVLLGCFLCLMTLFVLGGVHAKAASKKVKLVPEITYETHNGYFLKIKISLAEDKIASVEYQKGKVKKSADKYWTGANTNAWRDYNKDKKNTYYSFEVTENGYYSVRVTTTKGKKYTANIKISNIAPKSDDSRRMAFISKVSKPDSKGNFTVTADYYRQLTAYASDFKEKAKGDVISIDGRQVEIVGFYKMISYYDSASQDSFNDETEMVVVKTVNAKDFADVKDDYYDDYDGGEYGYIVAGNNVFYAYLDYGDWMIGGEYYVGLNEPVKSNSKLKITKDTMVELCLTNSTISGTDYFSYIEGYKEAPDGMYISKHSPMHIYEKYDKKKDKFTNTVSEIVEIYRP